MFCYGLPGAGKTVMAATVIDHLQRNYLSSATENSDKTGVAYLYYDHQACEHQKPETMLASIAKQFLARQMLFGAPLPTSIKNFYQKHRCSSSSSLSLPIISELVQSSLSFFETVYIVVDALDEGRSVKKLLAELQHIQAGSRAVHMFFTSRRESSITEAIEDLFPRHMSLGIAAQDGDMERYIDENIAGSTLLGRRSRMLSPEDKHRFISQAKSAIIRAANGMYVLFSRYTEVNCLLTIRELAFC